VRNGDYGQRPRRVAQAFDLAGIANTAGCPVPSRFLRRRESEMPAPSGFDHVSTTKSNSTRSIAAHPCRKRKDGAPSVGMVHAKIVKGGPPARRKFWNKVCGSFAYLCHPKGITCLECGFLGSDDFEVRKSDRILLACRGQAGCPPLDKLHCDRNLWVDYELGIFDSGREGLFDEVNKKRRPCEGFLRYRPGWTPSGHRTLLQNKLERRDKILISATSAIGAAVLALVGDWLLKRLGLK